MNVCVLCIDLVIGSPYDGPDGSGAVYIYHGSPEGIRSVPSQVCQAADIDSRLVSFGYSVSAGTDMDSNGYPGPYNAALSTLAVGPGNAAAAMYRQFVD